MPSIQTSHIAQVAIPVQDVERAKIFYGQRLGLTHLFDAPPGLAFFQCGETRLMLSRPANGEPTAAAFLYYAVESAEAAEAALAGDGVAFEESARHIARVGHLDIWLAVCRDGEGNLVGLMSHQEPA